MNSCCLNSHTMSKAVGIPAEADAPAPSNHIRFPARNEKRRTKSSTPISGGLVSLSIGDIKELEFSRRPSYKELAILPWRFRRSGREYTADRRIFALLFLQFRGSHFPLRYLAYT